MPPKLRQLGLASGMGLVFANMVGAGVFLSTGFMAQEMTASWILLAWVVGALLALSGSITYGAVCRLVPRSGGEYRFLSALVHPALGFVAGWASLILGFSAPIAVDALAAGAFLQTIVPAVNPKVFAVFVVVGVTAAHAFHLGTSKRTQDALVALKVLLVFGFLMLGLLVGSHAWPTWSPPSAKPLLPTFMSSLFYIAFAFSGWNAAVYALEEFKDPQRDAPRSMLLGCAAVAALYLAFNWVFVTNLTPEAGAAVMAYEAERVTLAHVLAVQLAGESGGAVVSGVLVVAFISASSAMTFVGPRVHSAMAHDGFLPAWLRSKDDKPPTRALWLQAALVVAIMFSQPLQSLLHDLGALLVLFSALTAFAYIYSRSRGNDQQGSLPVVAAIIYALSSCWMLSYGLMHSERLWLWIGSVVILGGVGYFLSRRAGSGSVKA